MLLTINKKYVPKALESLSITKLDDSYIFHKSYYKFFESSEIYGQMKDINKGDLKISFTEEEQDFLSNSKFKEPIIPVINSILSFKQGIIQLPTGFGKTWIISYLIKKLTEQLNLRVLVLTTSTIIKGEIFQRMGVTPFYYNEDSLFNIVHITGFIQSKYYKEHKTLKYDVLIYDESDSVPDSLGLLLSSIQGVKYKYGFSATPNKQKYGKFNPTISELKEMSDYAKNIFDYFGDCIIYRELAHDIKMTTLVKYIPYKAIKWEGAEFYQILTSQLKSLLRCEEMKDIIQYIRLQKQISVFVPFKTNTLIDLFVVHLEEMNISYVRWDSSSIYYPKEKLKLSQLELKEKVEAGEIEFVLSTSVTEKGLNIDILSDILILQANSYGNLAQLIGRSVRYTTPHIWVLNPKKKGEYLNSSLKRIKTIEESINLTQNREIIL